MYEHNLKLKKDEIWDTLDEETKKTYGKEYLDAVYNTIVLGADKYPDDLTPVIRAMRSGLLSKRPRERYAIGGGADTVTYMSYFLPVWLVDKVLSGLSLIPSNISPVALNHR